MSKAYIGQMVFVAVQAVAVIALGVEILGPGAMDPDVIIPWAYVAAIGLVSWEVCPMLQLWGKSREKAQDANRKG